LSQNVAAAVVPAERITNRTWVLVALFLVYLSNYIDRTVIYLLQEPIKHEFHLADWEVGLLGGTAFGLFYALLGIPIARLAERYNRVNIITFSLLAWSAMTMVCGLAQNFVHLLFARIGVAVGEAGGSPPSHSIITDYFPPERRATALAIYVLAVPVGQMFGALLGGSLADLAGWRMAFVIVGAPGMLLAALVWLTVREPPRGYSERSLTATTHVVDDLPSFLDVLRYARKQKAFLHVVTGSTVLAFASYGTTAFLAAFFLRRFELSLSTVGLIFGLIAGLMMAMGVLIGGVGADWLARKDKRVYAWLPAACFAICAPFYMLGVSQNNWVWAMAFLIVPGIFANAHLGSTYGIMHNSFPPRMRATVTSMLFLAHAIVGLSLGSLAVGLLSDFYAAQSFTLGVFGEMCKGGGQAATLEASLKTACRIASADGVQYAIMTVSPLYLWAALHYLAAAKHIKDVRGFALAEQH
jgi:predicted MFS family arabinose efflux permease